MNSLLYFDVENAIKIHDKIIKESGGIFGILNVGIIESILEHIKNDVYYPNIEEKTTHLFYSINKSHSFSDGNKRASIALSTYFLELNGFGFVTNSFIQKMENFAIDVATNKIDKELLFEIIYSILFEFDFSDDLKLKIIEAKSSQ